MKFRWVLGTSRGNVAREFDADSHAELFEHGLDALPAGRGQAGLHVLLDLGYTQEWCYVGWVLCMIPGEVWDDGCWELWRKAVALQRMYGRAEPVAGA
jgi:hypothetical protein